MPVNFNEPLSFTQVHRNPLASSPPACVAISLTRLAFRSDWQRTWSMPTCCTVPPLVPRPKSACATWPPSRYASPEFITLSPEFMPFVGERAAAGGFFEGSPPPFPLVPCFNGSSALFMMLLAFVSAALILSIFPGQVSSFASGTVRTGKPFNPLLGETYELDRMASLGCRVVLEQVSHHPPMCAMHAEGRDWVFFQVPFFPERKRERRKSERQTEFADGLSGRLPMLPPGILHEQSVPWQLPGDYPHGHLAPGVSAPQRALHLDQGTAKKKKKKKIEK